MATFAELLSDQPAQDVESIPRQQPAQSFASLIAPEDKEKPTLPQGVSFAGLLEPDAVPSSAQAQSLERRLGREQDSAGAQPEDKPVSIISELGKGLKSGGREVVAGVGDIAARAIETRGFTPSVPGATVLPASLRSATPGLAPLETIAGIEKAITENSPALKAFKKKAVRGIREWAAGWREQSPQDKLEWSENPLAKAANVVGQGVPLFGAAIAASVATKSPVPAAILFGSVEGAGTFEKSRAAGKTVARSQIFANLNQAWNIVSEGLPFDSMLKSAGKRAVTRIAKGAVTEGVQELIQTVGSNLIEKVGFDPARGIMEGWLEAIVGGGVLGGVGGGVISSGSDAAAPTVQEESAQPPPVPAQTATAEQAVAEPVAPIAPQDAPITAEQVAQREALVQARDPSQEFDTNIATAARTQLRQLAKELGVNQNGPTKSIRKRVQDASDAFDTLAESDNPVDKMVAALNINRSRFSETKKLRTKELGRRVGELSKELDKPTGAESIMRATAKLKGELPISEGRPINDFFDRTEIDSLIKTTKTSLSDAPPLQRRNAGGAILRIMNGQHLRPFEIKQLGKVFGPEFEAAVKPATGVDRAANAAIQFAGMLRTIKTMLDVSAIGRQGAIISIRNPKQAGQALRNMAKGLFNQKNYEALHDAILSDPRHAIAKIAGLYIAPVAQEGTALTEREEAFMSEWADKIPGAKISERAFNGYLNSLRADTFNKFVDKWGDTAAIEDYKKLASFINAATGRGEVKGDGRIAKNIEQAMPLLSTAFFSPRWVLSRIQLPFTTLSPVRDADTGKLRWSPANTEAIKSSAAYFGLMASIVAMAKAAGADVEDDLRSSDFGKIKLNNTRVDLSAGMSQYWRFLAQMITESRKTLSSGKVSPVDREQLLWRMIRSKASPVAGSLASALFGKTFTGDEFIPTGDEPTAQALAEYAKKAGFSKTTSERIGKTGQITVRELMPLIIQQTIEGVQTDGLMGGLVSGAGEFIGVSTSSFKSRGSRKRSRDRKRKRRS